MNTIGMAYKFNESFFEDINSEEKAYWLGFVSADGGINIPGIGRDSGWVLCINLKKEDKEHLEKFQKSIERFGPIYETDKCVRLQIGSERLIKSLIAQGVGPQKSHTLKPWKGPKIFEPAYWRGLFDGDGSISKTFRQKKEIEYVVWRLSLNGNRSIVDGFQSFIQKQGIKRSGSLQEHSSIYKLQWGGFESVALVAQQFYKNPLISLERKRILFKELLDSYETKTSNKK